MSKLQTGRIYLTGTINNLIAESEAFAKFAVSAIARHKNCDWGDVCKDDALQKHFL